MSRRTFKEEKLAALIAVSPLSHPKQPRQYAQECLALPESERIDYLLTVPLEFLETIEFYVNDHERKLMALVAHVVKQPSKEMRVKAFERTPSSVREEVSRRVIAHYEQKRAQKK